MQESVVAKTRRFQQAATLARYGTGLILLVMFAGTHYPGNGQLNFGTSDKTVHFVAYLVLSFAFLASWELSTGLLRPQHYFLVWLLGTIYSALDEITQIPVGRSCDGMDWLADIAGIVVGLTLFRIARPLLYRFI